MRGSRCLECKDDEYIRECSTCLWFRCQSPVHKGDRRTHPGDGGCPDEIDKHGNWCCDCWSVGRAVADAIMGSVLEVVS